MFKKLSILIAQTRVLQAALVCESDSLPLASQKAADSFSSCCSFFEATEPAFEASEAVHAHHCFRLKGFIVPLNRSAVWLAFCILIHFDFSVRRHLPQEVISTVLSTPPPYQRYSSFWRQKNAESQSAKRTFEWSKHQCFVKRTLIDYWLKKRQFFIWKVMERLLNPCRS